MPAALDHAQAGVCEKVREDARLELAIDSALVLGGGFGYWYYASQKLNDIAKDASRQIPSNFKTSAPEFEAVYAQLGIQPLPSTVERQQRVQARLSQLSREPCYRDAVVDLGRVDKIIDA